MQIVTWQKGSYIISSVAFGVPSISHVIYTVEGDISLGTSSVWECIVNCDSINFSKCPALNYTVWSNVCPIACNNCRHTHAHTHTPCQWTSTSFAFVLCCVWPVVNPMMMFQLHVLWCAQFNLSIMHFFSVLASLHDRTIFFCLSFYSSLFFFPVDQYVFVSLGQVQGPARFIIKSQQLSN